MMAPMRNLFRLIVAVIVLLAIAAAGAVTYVRQTGLRGQPEPGAMETRVARSVRALAVPAGIKAMRMPAGSDDTLWMGMEHFARYCALCHANNGSGEKTPIGNGLYPKPPDLRADATQQLTDGELYYIIDNGVRFTGMPAFGTGNPGAKGDDGIWRLVQFVRRLPKITPDELSQMEGMNPL
jgi:mono/diheme cytochrome c family protein